MSTNKIAMVSLRHLLTNEDETDEQMSDSPVGLVLSHVTIGELVETIQSCIGRGGTGIPMCQVN